MDALNLEEGGASRAHVPESPCARKARATAWLDHPGEVSALPPHQPWPHGKEKLSWVAVDTFALPFPLHFPAHTGSSILSVSLFIYSLASSLRIGFLLHGTQARRSCGWSKMPLI